MQTQKYKETGNRGFFDEQETQQRLSAISNPLDKISLVIDFELFRAILEKGVLNREKKAKQEQNRLML